MSKYCVIGKSLPHTLSPQIHAELGCENYGVVEIENEQKLADFVLHGGMDGYNVTIPYKQAIMPLLDEISEGAKAIGAVNTVVIENGKRVGYNTDIDGLGYAISRAGIELSGKNVLILGSGGTCQTAKRLCALKNAKSVNVVSRSGEINYDNCYELEGTQVIINTTPVGMMPNVYASPIDLSKFSKLEGVFDCIYNPLETMLIKQAHSLGLKAANGLGMLVEQARVAHNLFERAKGGVEKDRAVADIILANLTRERQNIVLIGMAGSGKSTVGRKIAELLGREFVDTDEEIVKEEKSSIPDIFAERGEAYFRKIESEIVQKVCLMQGLVIATGGGAVLDEKNRFIMGANGVGVFLKRDADMLATADRPLSSSKEKAKALYETRYPIYVQTADIEVENSSSVEAVAKEIINKAGY